MKWNMEECTGFILVFFTIAGVLAAGCTGPVPPAEPGPVPAITSEPAAAGTLTANPAPALTIIPTTVQAPVPTTGIITASPTASPTNEPFITEEALKALVQDAKNRLDMLKNTDKADTILITAKNPGECDVKLSKELGYLIDANTGEMTFIKGDYGSISLDRFRQDMTRGHSYVILHSHAKDWIVCQNTGTIGLNTVSLGDLAAPANLTKQGYHILKIIAVSDKNYEVYPRTPDNWKTSEEVSDAFARIEQRMEVQFHYDYYDPDGKKLTWYDVDMIMPLLTKDLDYAYIVNNAMAP
jgi:hypothetical protein